MLLPQLHLSPGGSAEMLHALLSLRPLVRPGPRGLYLPPPPRRHFGDRDCELYQIVRAVTGRVPRHDARSWYEQWLRDPEPDCYDTFEDWLRSWTGSGYGLASASLPPDDPARPSADARDVARALLGVRPTT